MQEFEYVRAATIAEAAAALRRDGARPLAGGTDIIPQMREGRRHVSRVVDLKHVEELAAVAPRPDGGMMIGATAAATIVAHTPAIAGNYPAVASSARLIGGVQIQNRASLGGNVCNAAPSADAVPALLVHDALAIVASHEGRREVPLASLLRGPGRTALQDAELLVAIALPPPAPRSAAAYLRFTPRREMDIAIVGSAAWIALDEQGVIADARIALASVAPTAIRAPSAERLLLGARPTPALFTEAGRRAAQDARPISDTRASADFRSTLLSVLTARALANCCEQMNIGSKVA